MPMRRGHETSRSQSFYGICWEPKKRRGSSYPSLPWCGFVWKWGSPEIQCLIMSLDHLRLFCMFFLPDVLFFGDSCCKSEAQRPRNLSMWMCWRLVRCWFDSVKRIKINQNPRFHMSIHFHTFPLGRQEGQWGKVVEGAKLSATFQTAALSKSNSWRLQGPVPSKMLLIGNSLSLYWQAGEQLYRNQTLFEIMMTTNSSQARGLAELAAATACSHLGQDS